MSATLSRYFEVEHEDDLTTVVFGLLELLGPELMTEILDLEEPFTDPSVRFHERIDPRAIRIPDVCIETPTTTVLVEAKLGTTVDPEQLEEEHADLTNYGNANRHLLLVTGHESAPAELESLDLAHLEWLSWGDIAIQVSNVDRSTCSHTQRGLLALLQRTLEREGHLPFTGFSERLLESYPEIYDLADRYHGHIARFHRDVEGRIADGDLTAKNMWRDGVSQDFNRFPAEVQFITTHLWIAYGEPGTSVSSKGGHYPFVAFCIEDRETPMVRVGYSMSPNHKPGDRRLLADHADAIVDFALETDRCLLCAGRNFHVLERLCTETEMASLLTETDTLGSLDRIQLVTEHGGSKLADPSLSASVAAELQEVHEFSRSRLYP